ncbi:hypothetical protein [Nostoc sp. 106C]|uniref:hypothetical protein n=1 Tax=Nostoc sp. 106C TaxID=1932667 RepID=UPI001412D7EA|nr:hypothetical protein [Nostoc sp. 106C]
MTTNVSTPFEWAQRQMVVLAMSGGVVYTRLGRGGSNWGDDEAVSDTGMSRHCSSTTGIL